MPFRDLPEEYAETIRGSWVKDEYITELFKKHKIERSELTNLTALLVTCDVAVVRDEVIIKYDPDRQSYEIILEQADGKTVRIFDLTAITFEGYKFHIEGKALLSEDLPHGTMSGIRKWDDEA